jgi:phage baseplate assembly protein W
MDEPKIDLDEYRILKNDDFIYRDLEPRIGEKLRGYDSAFDQEAIKNSLMNIFLVQRNEVPGKPQFGNPLQLSLFDNFDYFTESSMKQAIKIEIDKYEPRVTLIDININLMPEYNRIVIEVVYQINLKENNIVDSIYLPFSQNDHTYLGGRTITTLSKG